jgi:DNA repair protein RecO (recombination protein O)
MPVHETEALVLRQYSLSDSDRIIVFITREYGKIRAVARGIKKPKSRLSGCLEPLNHIRLEYWERENRELSQVRQAELIHSYLGKHPNLRQVYAFSYFAEIVNELVQDSQANSPLFRLILACLQTGELLSVSPPLLRYFEIWCLKLNGLVPDYGYCSGCGKCVKDERFYAWIEAGQARCPECAQGRGLQIGAAASSALAAMLQLPPEKFAARHFSGDAAQDLERLSQRLLGFHLEKLLKSYRMLRESFQD